MNRMFLVKASAVAAMAAGMVAGFAQREAQASGGASVSNVYLWKDTKGRCPATCDRNMYDCPCMVAPQ